MITSRHNQKLKDIRRLRRSKGDHALLEGPHLVEEAITAGHELETVLATPAWLETPRGRALAWDRDALATATPDELRKLLTAIVRSDRFTEGSFAGAYESGLLLAIARRAAKLLEGS